MGGDEYRERLEIEIHSAIIWPLSPWGYEWLVALKCGLGHTSSLWLFAATVLLS
jgi:hypothetical protein